MPAPLTILTDADVKGLLDTLTRDDLEKLHMALADALHEYSTGVDDSSVLSASNQPPRTLVKTANGASTLFMPSLSDKGLGIKVLTLTESLRESESVSDISSLSISEENSSGRGSSVSSDFAPPSRTSTISTQSSLSPTPSREGSIHSSSTPKPPPAKMADSLKQPIGLLPPSTTSPKGSVTIMAPCGTPRAIINASTLTAFRTALASTLCFRHRHNVHTVTIFGAGLQAYWHLFLALLIRGQDIHHVNIINRDFERAQRMLMQISHSRNDAVVDAFMSGKIRPGILTHEFVEYKRLLKEQVRAADVIFCCTPSTKPLFPPGHLTHPEGRKKARFIAAIGSYKPHMQELHEDILRQAVRGPDEDRHHASHLHLHHRHANEGGAVIVDTIEGALRESGELIKAGISGQGVVEIGELVMLKRSHWAAKAEEEARERAKRGAAAPDGSKPDKDKHHGGHGLGHLFHHHERDAPKEAPKGDGGLKDWLMRGNVVYKSVGMGLMDLVVGIKLVELAEERGFGTRIDDF